MRIIRISIIILVLLIIVDVSHSMYALSHTQEDYITPNPTPVITPEIKYVYITPNPTPVITPEIKYVYITPNPTPVITTNNDIAAWEFIAYVQNNWKYISDTEYKVVQTPQESYRLLSGDCDDFATMIAYYLEEIYGYDTKLIVTNNNGELHLVAFVQTTNEFTEELAEYCGQTIPLIGDNDITYIPIDWTICPDWEWSSLDGTITTHEWEYYIGKLV
jgi:hypothetical protein